MADAGVQDLSAIDRDVARAVGILERWREALTQDPDGAGEEPELDGLRRVIGRSAWAALGELTLSAVERPLRDALRQWVVALTQARVGAPAEAAWARAVASPAGRLEREPARLVSWREAWRGLVAARAVAQAQPWLEAAAGAAPPVAEAARIGASRRLEVARRFGMEHPWAAIVELAPSVLRAAARRLLDDTEGIATEVRRAIWPARVPGPAAMMVDAVGRQAGEGWPARLTSRWLEDLFGREATRGPTVALGRLPAVLGAASFARALGAFGRSLRDGSRSTLPFALAREPGFVARHRFGFVFASLAADPEWQARALGLGRRAALGQARVLARSALLEARLHAARLLLCDEAAFAPVDTFDEIGPRLFGAPLDPRLLGAWPAPRLDEPARFVALLQALEASRALRDRFDADWFRNPRAWDHLRIVAAGPAREPVNAVAFDAQATRLATAFEEALG